jgi:TFIIH basal transcription factor complex TTD-A subunit
MVTYNPGVLVECDPSIKAIIMRINEQQGHDIVIDDIDDEHVLIKAGRHDDLKFLLKEVRFQLSQNSGRW